MFRYGKKIAVAALILYIITAAAILIFSLMNDTSSGDMSAFFYNAINKVKYGEVKNETPETIPITSFNVTIASTDYTEGSKTPFVINSIEPQNFSEYYSIKTDNADIAFYENGYLYFKSPGTVKVWAQSESGVRSEVFTIKVSAKHGDDFAPDPEKFTVNLPDELPVNDAVYLKITYDGSSPDFSLTIATSGPVEFVKNRFFVTKEEGEAKLDLIYKDKVVFTKTVRVTDEALPMPVISSLSVDNELIDGDLTLKYNSIYNVSATFEGEGCRLFYITAENKNVLFNLSADRDYIRILTKSIGKDTLRVFSPLDTETVLLSFDIDILPAYPTVKKIKIYNSCIVGQVYDATPVLADQDALSGITVSVDGADGSIYSIDKVFNIKFHKEGRYTLVYRSEYYDDFEFRYEVFVKDYAKEYALRKTLGHAALFVVLGVFALFAFCYFAKKPAYKAIITAISGIAVAIISEVLQLPIFTSGRSFSVLDMIIDSAGFAVGAALSLLFLLAVYLIRNKKSRSASSKTVE